MGIDWLVLSFDHRGWGELHYGFENSGKLISWDQVEYVWVRWNYDLSRDVGLRPFVEKKMGLRFCDVHAGALIVEYRPVLSPWHHPSRYLLHSQDIHLLDASGMLYTSCIVNSFIQINCSSYDIWQCLFSGFQVMIDSMLIENWQQGSKDYEHARHAMYPSLWKSAIHQAEEHTIQESWSYFFL